MAKLKAGTRLRSAVCTTEVMVIAAPEGDPDLTCGGVGMLGVTEKPPEGGSIQAGAAEGTKLGKRYVTEAGDLEVLCVKAGDGSLGAGGAPLKLKEAKKLPSSD
jgi:hypothetical protein